MSWVAIGAAGISAIPSVAKLVSGNKQAKKGQQLIDGAVRPMYTKPTEVSNATGIVANNYFNPNMPGSNVVKSQIGSVAANSLDNAVEAATSSGDVLDAVAKIDFNKQQQLTDLGVAEAEFAQQQEQKYINQLLTEAGYTDKQFDVNKMQPYVNQVAQGEALLGAGAVNKNSALSDFSKIGAGMATSHLNNKLIYDPAKGKIST